MAPKVLLPILLFVFAIGVSAQDPVKWRLDAPRAKAERSEKGQKIEVSLNATIEEGWHLYALDQPRGGPIATTIKATDGSPWKVEGSINSPKQIVRPDPNFIIDDKPLETRSYTNDTAFKVPLVSASEASIEQISLDVRFQACNDSLCLPPRTMRVTTASAERVTAKTAETPNSAAENSAKPIAPSPSPLPQDIWPFIWLAITLGALSLLTPCVFPMIPITVSYFANHSGGSRSHSVKLALIYSLGIIATFTIAGMMLAIFLGAAGVNLFAANPWINLLITAIFLFFAFNLFGAYEIAIPSAWLTKLDSFTRQKEGKGSGVVGALLMGLTFTLTSFTCTSPFVGTILVSASQGNWRMPLLGMLAFSVVFALPFFVLALAPQLVNQLPRSGGWMNSVKVSMGFLEVAAAMKFLSNADLVWHWGIFTRPVVIAIWIAIFVVLAVYLLGKFQLSHDPRPEKLGAVRLMASVASLALAFYLLTGLFGAKLGEIESFLPPAKAGEAQFFAPAGENEPKWIENDLETALAKAKSEGKPVFLDFTGYTCTNCRWMEANMFPREDVKRELSRFVLAKLYTDGSGEIFERHQRFEEEKFGTVAMPFYAIIDADGMTRATFPGLTRNHAEFIDFLRESNKN
ncbi:MAG TPA: cytochrome c biogenesis protein CcdA [Pyrinomonadaceae bacterium]|nr:cytochrome c biogenesis protein CcdA [Pyrinomonadaceae bacterium]